MLVKKGQHNKIINLHDKTVIYYIKIRELKYQSNNVNIQQHVHMCIFIKIRAYNEYLYLYNNQINARALIGQSAMGYCAGKPMEKSRVF